MKNFIYLLLFAPVFSFGQMVTKSKASSGVIGNTNLANLPYIAPTKNGVKIAVDSVTVYKGVSYNGVFKFNTNATGAANGGRVYLKVSGKTNQAWEVWRIGVDHSDVFGADSLFNLKANKTLLDSVRIYLSNRIVADSARTATLQSQVAALPTYTASNGVLKTGSNFSSDTTYNRSVANSFSKAQINTAIATAIATIPSYTAGYGILKNSNAFSVDTASSSGIVSKSRLATNLNGYYKVSNPAGYISTYTESDPLYTANGVPKTRTVNGQALSANVTLNTDNVAEGVTNQYTTTARTRAALTAGYGWLYSNTTGVGTVDTASNTGIVSKPRLAAALAGYVRGVTLSTGSASFTSSSLLAGSTTVVTVTLSTPFTDSNYQIGSPLIFGSGGVSLLGGTFTLVSVVKNPTTVVVTLKNNALLSLAVSGTVDIVALRVSN